MKLYVMALPISFQDMRVPLIGLILEFGMPVLEFAKGQLLHHFREKRRADPVPVIQFHQAPHGTKQQLFYIARAVAAQFPVIGQCHKQFWFLGHSG